MTMFSPHIIPIESEPKRKRNIEINKIVNQGEKNKQIIEKLD